MEGRQERSEERQSRVRILGYSTEEGAPAEITGSFHCHVQQ
jgi:hypothetical protein